MMICRIECVGISPILFKRMPQEFKINHEQKDIVLSLTRGDIASANLYRDDEGRIVLPVSMLKRRLIATGSGTTERRWLDASFVFHGDYIPLLDPHTGKSPQWKVYQVSVPAAEESLRRIIRAQIDRWSFSLLIDVTHMETRCPKKKVQTVFERTGRRIRLGWQPEEDQTYGQFVVDSIDLAQVREG